jgi:dihydroorotase
MADPVLRGGRIIDPASGRDETADIAFGDGKITEIARDLPANGAEIVDVRGRIVAPGLIDLHTHVYWGGTSLGVEAVEVARQSGTTTFVDAGSAGAGTFHGFRRHVIEQSPLHIIPYLNVSFPGIFALSAAVAVGECADLRLLDPRECGRVNKRRKRAGRRDAEEPDRHGLLLRAKGAPHRHRAAQQQHQLAPPHSITSFGPALGAKSSW